jgi:hypothetical protein
MILLQIDGGPLGVDTEPRSGDGNGGSYASSFANDASNQVNRLYMFSYLFVGGRHCGKAYKKLLNTKGHGLRTKWKSIFVQPLFLSTCSSTSFIRDSYLELSRLLKKLEGRMGIF